MPRQEAKLEVNRFTAGLNTDATELTPVPDATTDEDNFNITKEGTRRRRFGMEEETGDFTAAADIEDPSLVYISNARWTNVNKKGELNFEVVQIGNNLYFFDVSVEPFVDGVKGFSIDLNDYKAPLAVRTDLDNVSIASGKGALFVCSPSIIPFYVEYDEDADDITVTALNIKIRDLSQLDTGDTEASSSTITAQRRYDLLNQGWYKTDVIIGSSSQQISIKTKSKNPDTSIPGYEGAIIDGFREAFGVYPPKTKPWWIGRGFVTVDVHIKKPGIFNDTKYSKEVEAFSKEAYDLFFGGNTVAPLGHYLVDPFYKDRSGVSGVDGLDAEYEKKRPNAIAFYGGRAFYGFNNSVYFSQVIFDDLGAAARCYQDADPTAEDTIGLIASDGGVVTIPDMGNIIRFFVIEGALMVFADNGVWVIYSPQGQGFSATNFAVDFVTNIPAAGYYTIVNVDGYPVYLGNSGVYAIGTIAERGGAFEVKSLSENKIQNYLINNMSPLSRKYAKGEYDRENNKIMWLWNSSPSPTTDRFVFNLILNYNVPTAAFYPYSIEQNVPVNTDVDADWALSGVIAPNSYSSASSTETLIDSNGDTVVSTSNGDVIITTSYQTDASVPLKYLLVSPSVRKLSAGAFTNTDFTDWTSATDYISYLQTHFYLTDDSMLYVQAPWIYTYLKTSSDVFPAAEGDGSIASGDVGGAWTGA